MPSSMGTNVLAPTGTFLAHLKDSRTFIYLIKHSYIKHFRTFLQSSDNCFQRNEPLLRGICTLFSCPFILRQENPGKAKGA